MGFLEVVLILPKIIKKEKVESVEGPSVGKV